MATLQLLYYFASILTVLDTMFGFSSISNSKVEIPTGSSLDQVGKAGTLRAFFHLISEAMPSVLKILSTFLYLTLFHFYFPTPQSGNSYPRTSLIFLIYRKGGKSPKISTPGILL